MTRRPVRRLALVTSALLASAALSSCATFSDNEVAARVEGSELTADEVRDFVRANIDYVNQQQTDAAAASGDTTPVTSPSSVDGQQMRSFIARWIQYQAIELLLEAEGLALTEDDLATARAEVLVGVQGDPPDALVEYAAWQYAIEAKFAERTADTDPTEYIRAVDVYVDPYYGTWNADAGTVDAFGG